MIQPLSGEYAGRRTLLESIPFFTGYAVEIGHLIDAAERVGIEGLGQVDLERRVHRNQELEGLSRMSFVILQAVMKRLEERRKARLFAEMGSTMKLPRSGKGRLALEVIELADQERPPMIRIPEYIERRRPADVAEEVAVRPPVRRRRARVPERSLHRDRAAIAVRPDRARLVQGLADLGPGRAGARRRLAPARPDDELLLCPLADGGEGTLEAIAAAGGWAWQDRATSAIPSDDRSPPAGCDRSTGRRGRASRWPRRRACHGSRPTSATRSRPRRIGTGELLARGDRRRAQPTSSWGSAGARRPTAAGALRRTGAVDATARLRTRGSRRLVDLVRSPAMSPIPLLGPTGAAAVFGPQKGASPERRRRRSTRGTRPGPTPSRPRPAGRSATTPGAGRPAASGSPCWRSQDRFRSFALRPGVDLVMEATDFDGRLARADLVITGEGRIDAQTASARRRSASRSGPQAAGVPCIAVGGGVEPEGIDALAAVGAIAVPVVERPHIVEAAMAAGTTPSTAAASGWPGWSSPTGLATSGSASTSSDADRPKPDQASPAEEAPVLEPGPRPGPRRLERYRPGPRPVRR